MTEKYVLEADIDHETGEEHCTVLKTDGTTNMANWIEIVSAMYTHHSILEPLIKELNKIQNNYNNTEKYAIKLWEEKEQLKQSINNLKDTIIKITIAYQRKYDRTIVDLVDEVHEENITDLIKELKE